jgi:aryl-phospho-beta-D-glucosidase BglC (GH1 family)
MLGVNLSGAEFGNVGGSYGTAYIYPNAAELDYYQSKGMELIRLPFLWERMQPSLNGALSSAELARMNTFLDAADARGMKVILDVQNFGRYNGQVIGSSAVPVSAFQDFWTKLANAVKGHASIEGYGLMNEPHDMGSPDRWPAAAQAAVNGIRTVDMTHDIMVGGDGWGGAWSWKLYNNNLWINDPANKIVYEAHQYFDHDSGGEYNGTYEQEGAYPTIGVDRLKPFVDWLNEHHARGYIGEFAVPDTDPRWLVVLDKFVAAVEQAGLDAIYWGGGPWWDDYPLGIEPRNGQDRPQMDVLEHYLQTGPVESSVSTVLDDSHDDLTLIGAANINGTGNAHSNVIYGNDGNNTLLGLAGNDTVNGGAGNDTLIGGFGKDLNTGSGGLDVIRFNSLGESGVTFATRDALNTFAHGDKIDLSAIDADSARSGNQAFVFSTSQALTHVRVQLIAQQVATNSFLVQADVNGDGHADFTLNVYTAPGFGTFHAWDFIL